MQEKTIARILAQFLDFDKPLPTKKLKTEHAKTIIAQKITNIYPKADIVVKKGINVLRNEKPAKRKIANKTPNPALI